MSAHVNFITASLLLTLGVLVSSASAAELTQPLTAEEVACNEQQLEKLLLRINAAKERYWPLPQLPTNLLVSYSNSVGFYDGLVATKQGFRLDVGGIPPVPAYEHYLAFNINPSIRTLLLNPARPELTQVGLSREQSSSNFVSPQSYFELSLTLEPTLGGGDPLIINNLVVPSSGQMYNGFISNSTKPGRGLIADRLLMPCHQKLTEFDRHVFAILQRMVRAGDMGGFHSPDYEFSIFRGEDPRVYRVNVYPIYEGLEPRGKMAVELELAWLPSGRLTGAVIRALPNCSNQEAFACTHLDRASTMAFLIPPVDGGSELYPLDSVENGVFFVWYEGPSEPATIDLEALLAHTTWNEPVW